MHPTSLSCRASRPAGLRRSVFVAVVFTVILGFGLHLKPVPVAVAQPPSPTPSVPPLAVVTHTTDSRPQPPHEVTAALTVPPGEKHDAAFITAIEPWILNDPAAAAGWIVQLTNAHDFDLAASLLVLHTDQLHRTTAVALTWAEDLADPTLRLGALAHVLREWEQQDPDAPLRYVERSPTLSADDREALRSALTPLPTET